MSGRFFHLDRGDRVYLLVLVVYSVVAFLPWWRQASWAGMSLFGWLMAALMVLSPVIAALRLLRRRRAPEDRRQRERRGRSEA